MTNHTTQVAVVAMHSAMGDFATNLARVEKWTRQARDQGAEFALFPEECITGSLNKSDLSFAAAREIATAAAAEAVSFLEALCGELGMTLVVGTIEPAAERLRNSALIVGPQGYLATFAKLHLPNPNEREWFVEGDVLPIIASQGWRFGMGICYDLRFPEIFRKAAQEGADFFLLPVGGSGGIEKVGTGGDQSDQARYHRELAMQLLPARAVDNALYVFYANQAGCSGRAWFPGLALALDPHGQLIGEHLPDEGMIAVEVSRDVLARARSSSSCTVNKVRPEVYGALQIATDGESDRL